MSAASRVIVVALAALSAAACAAFDTPADYNRHRLSEITLPRDSGAAAHGEQEEEQDGDERTDVFYFDVTVTAEFPANSEAAEAARMKWLAEWIEQRHMCLNGHEVLRKRKFDFMEDNPARRDLRYEVRCREA